MLVVFSGSASSACQRMALELAQFARAARDSYEFRAYALEAVGGLVACDTAVFVDTESDQPLATRGVDDAGLRLIHYCEQNFGNYASEVDPIMTALDRLGGVLDHDFFSLRDRRRFAFYADIVRPQYIDSMLVLVPKWRGLPLGMLRLQRSRGSAFRIDDLALAMQLLPAVEVSLAALHAAWPRRQALVPKLSARESEIVMHVARGLTTPQIALLLGTSRLTVRNQIGRIFDKLGISSRAELAAWAARSQLE
jgi:DNA-binding CsgD family transcriptional regulator